MTANEFLLERYRAETGRLVRVVDQLVANGKPEVSGTCEVWIVAKRDVEALLSASSDAAWLLAEEDPAATLGADWKRGAAA